MAAVALRNQQERFVQVNRLELVKILETNREKHLRDYEAAKKGYRGQLLAKVEVEFAKAQKFLSQKYEDVRNFVSRMSDEDIQNQNDYVRVLSEITVEMKVPRCYAKEYDAAIDMAKWDVRETLELSHAEFQCFVRDVWDWTNDFKTTSAMYFAE